MRISPAIAALRADPGLQRQAQAAMFAAMADWRALAAQAVLADLERYGIGATLRDCAALERLFASGAEAHDLASAFCRTIASALADAPFGHPPVRHGFDGTVSTLLLARSGRAQLVLHAREPGETAFTHVSFSDAVRHEAVLAGDATARVVRSAGLAREPMDLRRGTRIALDLAREALHVLEVRRRLISLRLQRVAAEPEPTREHALGDGALVHRSSGDLAASRRAMMLAVLGRMKCANAITVMAQVALEPGEASLRWQALRECLALDTAAGFTALMAIARSAEDTLRAAAGALGAQLVEAHPQLLALEADSCRA